MKIMIKRTNPNRQQYRIIGFNTVAKLKEHFSKTENIPKTYMIIVKEGEHFKKKFFDVNFVCLTDRQKSVLTKLCEECI